MICDYLKGWGFFYANPILSVVSALLWEVYAVITYSKNGSDLSSLFKLSFTSFKGDIVELINYSRSISLVNVDGFDPLELCLNVARLLPFSLSNLDLPLDS